MGALVDVCVVRFRTGAAVELQGILSVLQLSAEVAAIAYCRMRLIVIGSHSTDLAPVARNKGCPTGRDRRCSTCTTKGKFECMDAMREIEMGPCAARGAWPLSRCPGPRPR